MLVFPQEYGIKVILQGSVAAMGMTVGIVLLLEGVSSIGYACISRTKDI